MAKNVCPCPNPPGGQATCEEDQLAICRVVNGTPQFECITIPPEIRSLAEQSGGAHPDYLYFVLDQVTQGNAKSLGAPDVQDILKKGEYANLVTGDRARFRLPQISDEGGATA